KNFALLSMLLAWQIILGPAGRGDDACALLFDVRLGTEIQVEKPDLPDVAQHHGREGRWGHGFDHSVFVRITGKVFINDDLLIDLDRAVRVPPLILNQNLFAVVTLEEERLVSPNGRDALVPPFLVLFDAEGNVLRRIGLAQSDLRRAATHSDPDASPVYPISFSSPMRFEQTRRGYRIVIPGSRKIDVIVGIQFMDRENVLPSP